MYINYFKILKGNNLPGQTEDIHKNDMEIVEDLGFIPYNKYRSYQLSSCVPFPGTPLYNELVKKYEKEKLEKWDLYDGTKDTICNHS